MHMSNSNFILAVLAVAASGCVTSSNAPTYAQAPSPAVRNDVGVLYVVRENAVPYAFPGNVDVDGKRAAHLAQKGYTWFYVKPGTRTFKHYWPALAGMPKVEFKRDVAAGKTYVFEMTGQVVGLSISTAIDMLPLVEAENKMRACCRYVEPTEGAVDY